MVFAELGGQVKPQKPETKCLSLNLNSQDRYPHEELAMVF
jgi:hypothetical protein